MISKADQLQLNKKGIPTEIVAEQLKRFKSGFPFLKLEGAATAERGVLTPTNQEIEEYLKEWDNYCAGDSAILKFVPASGAASRMFKDLFAFLSADYEVPTTDFEKTFFENVEKFALFGDLNEMCVKNDKHTIKELMEAGKYKSVIFNLLDFRVKQAFEWICVDFCFCFSARKQNRQNGCDKRAYGNSQKQ